MKLRSLFITLLLSVWSLSAFAQSPAFPPAGPGMAPPAPPVLTKSDVDKLVVAIPEIAKAGGELGTNASMGPNGVPQPSPEDAKKLEALLDRYGFTFTDFFMKMTVLMSTYMALRPDEFDRQMPSEKNPEVQKVLNDPAVPEADKAALRKQVADIQANKETLRLQLTTLATEENKAVVKPMLAKVQKALEVAEAESRRAREKAFDNMKKAKAGPRRAASPATP